MAGRRVGGQCDCVKRPGVTVKLERQYGHWETTTVHYQPASELPIY